MLATPFVMTILLNVRKSEILSEISCFVSKVIIISYYLIVLLNRLPPNVFFWTNSKRLGA